MDDVLMLWIVICQHEWQRMRHLCVIEEMLLVDVFDLDFHKTVAYGYHSTIYHDHTCTNILIVEVCRIIIN